jgi:hypothetical protein
MKLRYEFTAALLGMLVSSALAQDVTNEFVTSLNETDRMSVIKTNIPLTEWHEKPFWSQYTDYRDNIGTVSLKEFIAVKELARIDKSANEMEAKERALSLFHNRSEELAVKRLYYAEIGGQHNGIIGLKFLQAELLMDLLEYARIYDQSPLLNFKLLPNAMPEDRMSDAKFNVIAKALALTAEEDDKLFSIYLRYEKDLSETLGQNYNLYHLFTGDPGDFTPGLAKRQGHDLLALIEREIQLKEKYFNEMNTLVGLTIAARFLAWEDYFATQCKLAIFAEAVDNSN